jgi:predicted nucleotidyltransferase
MPAISNKIAIKNRTQEGLVSTLAFFAIYDLPLTAERIWQLLYRTEATLSQVQAELADLVRSGSVVSQNGLYALKSWDEARYDANQEEIDKRWQRVERYRRILSLIPFVESMAVINSMAMGNADSESDIDFFVITKPKRLYFVRTLVILLFKLLGVYKTRDKMNQQFCFGFYLASDRLGLDWLVLPGEDPYLVYWMATILPLFGQKIYEHFIKENKWLYSSFPNFRTQQRLGQLKSQKFFRRFKRLLEMILWLPAIILEPLLRWVHIRHTYRLPENSWPTSSTVANRWVVKLHALDPRKDLRKKYFEILQNLK